MNKTEAPVIQRSYHIPLAMFDQAFRAFQKKYVYPRNIMLSVVLAVIAGVYVHAVVQDSSQTMGYLLIIVCVAMILIKWYNTFKLRRTVHTALAEIEQDVYALSVYEDGLVIRTEDAPIKTVPAEQPEPEQEQPQDGSGFHQLFPEEPAQDEPPIAPTEIEFGSGVKIHEFPEFFMVYLVRQNFYVIPKKDFSEEEIAKLQKLFQI